MTVIHWWNYSGKMVPSQSFFPGRTKPGIPLLYQQPRYGCRAAGKAIRAHWEIENSLHYVLDVIYDEDDNRSRKDHLAANFSALRKMCLNILRSYKKDKKTVKSIARRALINPSFAFDLIQKSGLVTD